MSDVVVGLDVHLKKTQVTIMKMNGEIVKREKVGTSKADLRGSLECVPKGSKVALESVGFCWPWIDFLENLGYKALLANPVKVKCRAEDVKTDKVDSELLAHLIRMNWLPTCYVPSSARARFDRYEQTGAVPCRLAEAVVRLCSLIGECCLKYARRNLRVNEVIKGSRGLFD